MDITKEKFIEDLCQIIATLGYEGGVISPSVYDTAQRLRYLPPTEGVEPGLNWLLECQMDDGGWGTGIRSHTRDIPTIAAIMAFAAYPSFPQSRRAIKLGLEFLEQHHRNWASVLPEDLPVGMELILPKLLSEAEQYDLDIPQDHYQNLWPIYQKKIDFIRSMPLDAGSSPTFSWEAWGEKPNKKWFDANGGVGHSPSATAYWAFLAKDDPNLTEELDQARKYLDAASKATRSGIPGVLPTAWPITRFEQSFVLYTLLMAGLLNHPQLSEAIQIQMDDLAKGVRPSGVGFTDIFMADGDDTAASVAVLCAAGKSVDQAILENFAFKNHYLTYTGELQASHSVTARAIYALAHFGADTTAAEGFLLSHQLPSGAWPADKWNISQYHGTCLATFALKDKGAAYQDRLIDAARFLASSQLDEGGWGSLGVPSMTDTAYALISLLHLMNAGCALAESFLRGQEWLKAQYASEGFGTEMLWLNKQQYTPFKVDQAFQLAAMLAVPQQPATGVS